MSVKKAFFLPVGLVFAFLFLGFAPSTVRAETPKTVRIGAYNIQIFGKAKLARPHVLAVLAKVAASFDAMTIEEVGSNGSSASPELCREILASYAEAIGKASGGTRWEWVQGDQFGVVYRADRFSVAGSNVYSGNAPMTYKPLAVYLKGVGFSLDFVLVAVHTRPSLAAQEIEALKTVMAEEGARYGEKDVVCAGDFNADGSYYEEGPGPAPAAFAAGPWLSVIPNSADTSVAASSKTLDRMELTPSMAEDWTGAWGVLRPGEHWDLSACEGSAKTAGTEAALSDHYPIWAEFRTGADTD